MDILDLLSWILRGSQRRAIFNAINNKMIPAEILKIAKQENNKINHNSVSDILKEFRENKIVTCLNPNSKKGRIYQLTSLGKKVKKKLILD